MKYSTFPTQLGYCGIAWRDGVVIATQLPKKTVSETKSRLARFGGTEVEPDAPIKPAVEQIVALLEGQNVDLSTIECDFSRVDSFEVEVYKIARNIPVGETSTYGDIAEQLGDKQLARRVGRAMGRNPFPIIVPCHRVVGANDNLVGFSAYGGIETKRKMLSIERGGVGETKGLFD